MGGIIFIALVFLGLVILVMRLLGSRAQPPAPENTEPTAHEAVISRLEDHRRRRGDDEK
ncbi:MAG TPA: hypothetical protein VGO52_04600 [Hyphomonadaceae bacterium]|jgi:hypothetical protein|nr:hypothetical protein [Hyphomonadaceae bacterium]